MTPAESIGVGVIGLGFMGRTHLAAYRAAAESGQSNHLVAVSDRDADRRAGRLSVGGNLDTREAAATTFDPESVAAFESPADLLGHPGVDVVSVCTPTPSHVDLAIQALEAGKHVLVEKPVALGSSEVERLARAAAASETLCMPAMCMRFWPAWAWLRTRIQTGEFGRVLKATFQRLGRRPDWSPGFYDDPTRSGGALFDLHIHDVDFVLACFGEPAEVHSSGTVDHITSFYGFEGGPEQVVVEGGWCLGPDEPFRMHYSVIFEGCTCEFELGRDPELRLVRSGEVESVTLPEEDGYVGEVRHLLEAIRRGAPEIKPDVSEALAVTRLLERERDALA